MRKTLTPRMLFDHLCDHIDLHWVAGMQHADRNINRDLHLIEHATLIGHLNLIHSNRIQVIGETEMHYLDKLRKNSLEDTRKQIFTRKTSAVIFSDGIEPSEEMIQLANHYKTPLFSSLLPSSELIDAIRYYLASVLAESKTVHGVFLEVLGTGVLLMGESSIGKSELALELVTRGHRLVADDAPIFTRVGPNMLNGTCPEVLQDFMEVRGLGVLNIRAMYGENAIKANKYLRLILHLKIMSEHEQQQMDRLYGSRSVRTIMEAEIPEIILPVASGRNLAVMVEAAVRNHLLRENGHDSSQEFIQKQSMYLT